MKARSRHWEKGKKKIPGVSVYPKGAEEFFKRASAEIFSTYWRLGRRIWSADIMGWRVSLLKVKGGAVLPGSPLITRPCSSFLPSTSHTPFSRSLSGPRLRCRGFCCWALAWEQHGSSPPSPLPQHLHLYTLIIGHHLPDLSLTSLLSTRQAHQHSSLTLYWHLGSQAWHSCHLSPSYTFVLFGHALCSVIPLSWVLLTPTSWV